MDCDYPSDLPDDLDALKALVHAQAEQHAAALRHAQAAGARDIAERDAHIAKLQADIRMLLARRFGASAETVSDAQLALFNEAEAEAEAAAGASAAGADEDTAVRGHTRRHGGRRALPEALPRVEVHHELPAAERRCPHHGVALERFDEEVSEQLDIVPASLRVLRHIRGKYRCPCCTGYLVTAALPAQPIPKSQASPGTLACVAAAKFVLGQPLYRQSRELERLGFELSRTTLANWMVRAGQLVQPLINLLREQLLEAPYLQMDETTVQVLREPGKAAESTSYLWVQTNPGAAQPVVLFDYDASRSSAVPMRLLEGFSGALHTDGYRGYDGAVAAAGLTRLYCLFHARRKFIEVVQSLGLNPKKLPNPVPPAARRALRALGYIKTLSTIERRIRGKPPDQRRAVRQRESVPVLEQLHAWAQETAPRVPPSTKLGLALGYLLRHWHGLIVYVEDGRYEMSTNLVENAIRPFAVGRRVWLFCDSVAGAKSSANLYSLIETAKLNALDPYLYLRHVFTWLPRAERLEDIEALLPGRVDPERLRAISP